jgi:hypothetical protein
LIPSGIEFDGLKKFKKEISYKIEELTFDLAKPGVDFVLPPYE